MTITIDRAVLEQALAALNLAHSSHGLMLLSDPPQEAWKVHRVDQSLQESSTALREALNAPQPTAMQDWEAIAADQAMTIAMQAATIESLKEQRLMQMTAITTAALGYWKEGDSILPDYDTIALRDVAKLYAKYEALNAPQPEPVAWTHDKTTGLAIPLYTTPPRREWEPLSLDQISMAWDRAYRQPLSQSALNFARDLEKTLKERNHE